MTSRQKLFFKELLTGETGAGAARKAGYSAKSARVSAHNNISKYNEFYLSLFVEAGIDIGSLAKSLRQGLASKDELTRFKYMKLAMEMIDRTLQSEHFTKVVEKPFNFSEEARKRMAKYDPSLSISKTPSL